MSAPDQDNRQPPSQTEPHQTIQTQAQDHAVQPPPTEPEPQTAAAPTITTTTTTTTQATATAQSSQHQEQQGEEVEEQQPPASPPLPQKHTPVTPGPRATRFTQLYDIALQRTLQKVSYDNFASCFPTIAAHAPNTLRNVQKQMVDYLEERCNTAPPAPDEVLAAHLAPRLASQQSHLNARLQNTQASNESLFAAVRSQRAEIDSLLAQLESHVADIDGANAMLVDVAPELAAEARASEAQMSGM
ncbi:uncharacterized protein ColSpa_06834 [Colletotrichum spaethianum]|uniref:Mind kinetochore complex component n=1 Tax=Colletotrichum spaethianum TaxID=700344 RepID=A0AA37LHK5_9PEZI|nr:uncharacterized protein ColSpa_06834 [Colletotrichum spaethianum]GKT46653.1 hypothetical protein ColSpa_06834 [Colletotrichum spaethianum]